VVEPYPLKNDGVKVSWDDEIPNIWKVIKFHGSKPPSSIGVKVCPSNHFAQNPWLKKQISPCNVQNADAEIPKIIDSNHPPKK